MTPEGLVVSALFVIGIAFFAAILVGEQIGRYFADRRDKRSRGR